ncbi:DUF4417 domain-containing protein [Parafrankia sp. FMc2]|uniref:DUF4417 domain-containing protein n=1 Tax=Parafrankia sp. FMc2 TaxID=3233196 RepID=UPI0034D3F0DC
MTLPRSLPLLTPAAGCHCPTCPFFTHNPAAAEPICGGSNSDCSYCGCARTEARAVPGDRTVACHTCPIRCGSRTDIAAWMADVGGTLTFDDIVISGQLPSGLPRYIPQVDGSAIADFDAELAWPAYAVGLRRVFSPDTFTVYPKFAAASGAHDALGLRPGQRAVLVGYGTDPLVEAFWSRRRVARLVEQIAAQRWDLVLAPNYSLYQNQPRTEHLINFRRNLMIAAEFGAAGVTAAPNLYWMRLEDLDRYLGWLADVTPPAVAINLQTFRQASSWETYALPGLAYLAAALPPSLPVILTGTSRVDRITTLAGLFGDRLILVSQNAAQYALHGAVMTAQGRVDVHARAADCFAHSTRFLASLLPTPNP